VVNEVPNLWRNIGLRGVHARQRLAVRKLFPALQTCGHAHFLSLYRFLSGCPERFYGRQEFEVFFAFLERQHRGNAVRTRDYVNEYSRSLDNAFVFLGEVNAYPWHDRSVEADEIEEIRFLDQQVHPAYLRLVEGTFAPLAHFAAYTARLDRGRSTEGLDLFNIVDELKRTPLLCLTSPYRETVRNGIAHAGVAYAQKEIRYWDIKGNSETLATLETARLFEDLVDTCNAMAFAWSLFLLVHLSDGYKVPKQILIEELRAEVASPWWRVDSAVERVLPSDSQLLLYAHSPSRDPLRRQYYSLLTAVLAEFFVPGYDSYAIPFRAARGLGGVAVFDGHRLAEARNAGPTSFADYSDVFRSRRFVDFGPRRRLPRLFRLFGGWLQILRATLPTLLSDIRKGRGEPTVVVRIASLHRSGCWAILRATVVISAPEGDADKAAVRSASKRIFKRALALARSNHGLLVPAHWLALGWGRIFVLRADHRRTRLSSFGLGADLICTLQVARSRRVRVPDIMGSTVEQRGKLRIAWNRAWMEAFGSQ